MPLHQDRITVALDMPEVKVLEVKEEGKVVTIKAIRRFEMATCPCCGKASNRIHSRWETKVRDLPMLGRKTMLVMEKRRFRCLNGCDPFLEEWDSIARYQRQTKRYQRHLDQACESSCIAAAVRKEEIGYKVIDRLYYDGLGETIDPFSLKPLPKVFGIDEFSGKRRVRMHLAMSDLSKEPKLWDVMETKGGVEFRDFFNRYSLSERLHVLAVVHDMDQGINAWTKSMFPLAIHVIDKFHLVRTLLKHLKRLRWQVYLRLQDPGSKLKIRKVCFTIRRRYETLNEMEKRKLEEAFEASKLLKEAYEFKEAFMKWYDTPKTRAKAESELCNLYTWLRRISHLKRFSWSLNQWWEPILNYFALTYTNGFAEGMNNKIKTIKRMGYGLRNFDRFRWRILKECGV